MARTRPDVYVSELRDSTPPVISTDAAAIPIVVGVASRGPVGEAVKLRAPLSASFLRTFGKPMPGETAFYLLECMERSRVAEAYFMRAVHYADPTDAGTMAGAVASAVADSISAAAPAQIVGAPVEFPLAVDPAIFVGDTLTVNLDVNTGSETVTIEAYAADVEYDTSTTNPNDGDPMPTNTTFSVQVGTGPVRAIDLSGEEFPTWAALAAELMARVPELIAAPSVDGLGLQYTSRARGSGVSIVFSSVSANAATALALPAPGATHTGSGMIANSEAITFAEIKDAFEDEISDLSVTLTSTGRIVVTTTADTPPATTELEVTGGNAAFVALLGLTGLASSGSEAGTVNALRFEAGWRGLPSPGEFGDNLRVLLAKTPRRASAGVGLDLALDAEPGDDVIYINGAVGVRAGTLLRLFTATTVTYATVVDVRSQLVGGVPRVRVQLETPLLIGFTVADSQVESVEYTLTVMEGMDAVETWAFVSPLAGADNYIVYVLNNRETGSVYIRATALSDAPVGDLPLTALVGGADPHVSLTVADFVGDEDARTGFEALRAITDAEAVMIAPSIDPLKGLGVMPLGEGVQVALVNFAETLTGVAAFVSPPKSAVTKASMLAWRETVLGVDSPAVTAWPWVGVRDRFGSGVNPVIEVPPVGEMFGAWARTLTVRFPEGGVARAAAGEPPYGALPSVVTLAAIASDKDHGDLNVAGINVIRPVRLTSGRTVPLLMGARTLSSDPNWISAPVRRTANYIARSLRTALQFAVFRNNNDPRRITPLLTQIQTFLRTLWRQGQIRGATESEAFFVADVTTAEDDANLTTRIRVGVAYQRPSEFIEVEMVQLNGGTVLLLAA